MEIAKSLLKPIKRGALPILAGMAMTFTQVAAAQTAPPLKVGVIVGFTGLSAIVGDFTRKSLDGYAKMVNAKGGIEGHQVVLTYVDSQSRPDVAVAALRKLAEDEKVHVVVCCGSSPEGIALKPVAAELQIPVIAAGQAAEIIQPPDQAKWMFRAQISQEVSLRAQLRAVRGAGLKSVALIGVNNAYGTLPMKLLPDLAKEYGLNVTGTQLFEASATDTKAQLTLLQGAHPDAVIVWAVDPAATLVAKNAMELGIKARFFQSPGAANPNFPKAGAAVEGTFVQATSALVPQELLPQSIPAYNTIREYNETWSREYKTTGGTFGASPWDSMSLIALAMRSQKPNLSNLTQARASIRDGIEGVKNYPGLNGTYSLSPSDHAGLSVDGASMLVIKDGRYVLAN